MQVHSLAKCEDIDRREGEREGKEGREGRNKRLFKCSFSQDKIDGIEKEIFG